MTDETRQSPTANVSHDVPEIPLWVAIAGNVREQISDGEGVWRDYRLYAFSGVLMAIFASMNVERTERGDEMFAVMAERPAWQAIDLDSLSLL